MKIHQINNLTNNEYHNGEKYKEYWSSSNLKEYTKSPREAHYCKFVENKESTIDLDFGTCGHDFMESKHITGRKFDRNVFIPLINPKTGESYGKATKTYQKALAEVENPISADDLEIIKEIYDMIMKSEYRWYFEKEILTKGIAEPSFFIEAGIHKYKYRPDVLTYTKIFDYKFIGKDHFYGGLDWVIKKYKFDISGAFYQYFEHKRTGIWKPFYIIWLMKEPPYDILIQDISSYCYELFSSGALGVNSGAMTFQKLKDQHELCQVSNQWPGMANQFEKFRGIRIAETSPRFERGFEEFEID